ncbi:MAG: alpha-galactosidase, partial [Actinomycetota bacterium]|nr:alpha-galactosidase [Actinomycetota bacterium]
SRAGHPRRPRPAVLNTWEAVYFDHGLERLTALADVAADVGVERFVLDDGWFLHRRDDRAGLGDWTVDPQVWPAGLGPLISHVRGLGMEFGLWVEPEMVNVDSDLYRAHPDWVLRAGDRLPVEWRHQQVLDLTVGDAFGHILDRLDALLRDHDIAFLKWDHNRDLIDAGHQGHPAVRAQTHAVYRLLDELRARHPTVEIESCASGGARVDLGILERTDRVWASDTIDALERQTIQRWTQLLLPPELVGSHVGPPTAHTTGRTHTLSFRGATALFGHFGIEWDISALDEDGRDAVRRLVATYRRHRALLHSGDVVHAEHPDPSAVVHGVVSPDRREAVFAYVALATSAAEVPSPARLPGLDPDADYEIEVVDTGGEPVTKQTAAPGWTCSRAAVPGRFLDQVGLAMPVLGPEQALVLHLRAI